MSARTLSVRARVAGRAEAPFDRLFDPLVDDLVHGGAVSRERFAVRWSDTDALRGLAERKRRALPAALAAELADMHRRLGASPATMANLDRLARGEAVATVAGQQPAPLVGPLYSLHKTAGAIGLAAEASARLGVPVAPVFWMHGEDSDFDEVRHATVADASLALRDLALPGDVHPDGGLVGALPLPAVDALTTLALDAWAGLPGAADVESLWRDARGRARDLGEAVTALLLALFANEGLVVIDPRLPAFRAAARGVIDRYLANAAAIEDAARRAGARLDALGVRRALSDASLDSFVFRIDGDARRKLSAAEARAAGAGVPLTPSVALRPAVQDGVLPTIGMAVGPGELAYLAQLREVFEAVGVEPAAPVPRFGATWLPADAVELIEAAGTEPWRVVVQTDAVLASLAESQVPAEARAALDRARDEARAGLDRFADAARTFDASFPQMVESARGKVDYQYARLAEGLAQKGRARLDREHPAWRRLRYVLLPGDKLQERRLASLEPVARRGRGVASDLAEVAREHASRLAGGVQEHWLLEV